jgi:hypothetical protein
VASLARTPQVSARVRAIWTPTQNASTEAALRELLFAPTDAEPPRSACPGWPRCVARTDEFTPPSDPSPRRCDTCEDAVTSRRTEDGAP